MPLRSVPPLSAQRTICGRCRVAPFIGLVGLLAGSAEAACTTVTAPNIAFGSIAILPGAQIDTTATISYSLCGSNGTVKRNCTSYGAGANSDSGSRRMASGSTNRLRYQLYSDAARTVVWGSEVDGYADGTAVAVDFTPTSGTRVVYARILASQTTAPPGTYTDTVAFRAVSANAPPTGCPVTGTTTNRNPTVTATIAAACQISASTLAFEQRVHLTSPALSTSTITLRCTNGTPWRVGLNGGLENNTAARKMRNGTNRIAYSLFRDAARTQNWGNVTGDSVAGTGTGIDQLTTVYGRVPAQTVPPGGAYSDTITVTVTY